MKKNDTSIPSISTLTDAALAHLRGGAGRPADPRGGGHPGPRKPIGSRPK